MKRYNPGVTVTNEGSLGRGYEACNVICIIWRICLSSHLSVAFPDKRHSRASPVAWHEDGAADSFCYVGSVVLAFLGIHIVVSRSSLLLQQNNKLMVSLFCCRSTLDHNGSAWSRPVSSIPFRFGPSVLCRSCSVPVHASPSRPASFPPVLVHSIQN